MGKYQVIVKDKDKLSITHTEKKAAIEAGKTPIVVCCESTAPTFQKLVERFDPDETTVEVFKSGFIDHKLTQILNYLRHKQLKTMNDIRPADYVDEIFGWANMLPGEVRNFFLDEFQFAFERDNTRNKNLWITRDKVMNEFNARREKEAVLKQRSGISALSLSNRYGAKADFLRVMNALFELHFFNDEAGNPLTKENFMHRLGEFFNTDLSGFSDNLNQAYNNTKLETNLKIFDEMKEFTQKRCIGSTDKT